MKKNILLTLFVAFFSFAAYSTTYYNTGTNIDPTVLTHWTTSPSGSGGTNPGSFLASDFYQIRSGTTMTCTTTVWKPAGGSGQIQLTMQTGSFFNALGLDPQIALTTVGTASYYTYKRLSSTISGTYNNLVFNSLSSTSTFTYQGTTFRSSSDIGSYPNLIITPSVDMDDATYDITATYNNLTTTGSLTINSNTFQCDETSPTITVGGNFLISPGATVYGTTDLGNPIFNISGTFTNQGIFYATAGSGSPIYNMSGTGTHTLTLTSAALSDATHSFNIVSGTVNLSSSGIIFEVGNSFNVTGGTFNLSGNTLQLDSTLTVSSGSFAGDLSSTLIFDDSPSGGSVNSNLPAFIIGTLTINRAIGIISMIGNVEVGTTLSLQSGTLSIGANTLTVDGAFSGSATITGGTTSNLLIDGASAATTIPVISGGLNTLTLSRSAGSTLGLGSPLSVINLTLTAGLLTNSSNNITVASGGTVTVDDGTLYQTPIYTGTANFVYVGNDNSNTGNEIPSSTSAINNFTLNKTGGVFVTLNSNPTVNGTLTISATSTLVAGSHIITIPGAFTIPSGGVFTYGTSTVIFNGSSSQTIPAATFYNLTNSNSSSTLGGSVTVNNTLTLNNTIVTSSNTLIIGSGGTISGAGSGAYVNGNLELTIASTSQYTYPVGTNTTYAPVYLTYSSVSASGGVTVSTTDGDESQIALSSIDPTANVKRFWTIAHNSGTLGSYSATFNFVAGDLGTGASTSSFIAEAYTSGAWQNLTVGTRNSTNTTVTGVSVYGDFQIGNQGAVTWTGASNTQWTTAGNWSSGSVPTSVTSVTIPSVGITNMPFIIGAATANSITINTGATLTLNTGSTLAVSGNFNNNGTFTDDGGVTTFNGSSAQTLTGATSFNSLTLNGTGGLTLSSTTTISGVSGIGVLSLTNGTLASGGNLVVDLDNALIGYSSGDMGTISGNITVTKSVSSVGNHYLGCPLQATGSGSTAGTAVAASQLNSATTVINASNGETRLYGYTPGSTDYTGITSLSTVLAPTTGYSLYFISSPATLTFLGGYLHSYTPSPTATSAGSGSFILYGNPYPSTLDWTSVSGWTKSNIYNAIYYYNSATYSYESYVNGAGVNNGTQYAPPLQAFYVATSASSGSIAVNNGARVTSQDPSFYREAAAPSNILRITASNDTLSDETLVRLIDGATYNFDSDFDAYKVSDEILGVPNPKPMSLLYTTINDVNYSINSLPQDSSTLITIPLNFSPASSGTYTFTANLSGMDSTYSVFLSDSLLNTNQNLRTSPTYSFSINQGDPQGRFAINLTTAGVTSVISTSGGPKVAIYSYDKKINLLFKNIPASSSASLSVIDMLGSSVLNVNNIDVSSGTYSYLSSLPTGIYIAMVNVGGSAYTAKIFIE